MLGGDRCAIYCADKGVAQRLSATFGTRLELFHDEHAFKNACSHADAAVAILGSNAAQDIAFLSRWRLRRTTPLVLVIPRAFANVHELVTLGAEELVWLDEMTSALPASLAARRGDTFFWELHQAIDAADRIPAMLRKALITLVRTRPPVQSSSKLARLTGIARSTLWRQSGTCTLIGPIACALRTSSIGSVCCAAPKRVRAGVLGDSPQLRTTFLRRRSHAALSGRRGAFSKLFLSSASDTSFSERFPTPREWTMRVTGRTKCPVVTRSVSCGFALRAHLFRPVRRPRLLALICP